MHTSIRYTAIAAIALSLTACASIQEKIIENAIEDGTDRNVDVDMNNDGTMRIETSEGVFDSGSNKLPETWPKDVPSYAGATVQYSASMNPSTGEAGAMAIFVSSDDMEEVLDFYKKEIVSQGWKITTTMDNQDSKLFLAEKDDRMLSISLAKADDKTSITIAVGDKD